MMRNRQRLRAMWDAAHRPVSRVHLRGLALVCAAILAGAGCNRPPAPETDPLAPASTASSRIETEMLEARAQADARPAEPYFPHRIGELEESRGDLAEAERALLGALERDPLYGPSLCLLTEIYYRSGRNEDAIAVLREAKSGFEELGRVFPDRLRAALALHYEALGDVARAAEVLIPLRREGAHWREVGSVLTYVTLQGEGYETAPPLAERAVRADDRSAVNHNNKGIAFLQQGQPVQARESFLRALEIDPDLAAAMYNLAIVEKYYFFDETEARDWFGRYAARSDEDPDQLRDVFGMEQFEQSTVVGDP